MELLHIYLYLHLFIIVSTAGLWWILWFSVRYAATTAANHIEIFGDNALEGKLHHIGS